MKVIRTITKEEEVDLCDLCGKEIHNCNGNTIYHGDKNYTVHMMEEDGSSCGKQVIVDAIEKKNKKNK